MDLVHKVFDKKLAKSSTRKNRIFLFCSHCFVFVIQNLTSVMSETIERNKIKEREERERERDGKRARILSKIKINLN